MTERPDLRLIHGGAEPTVADSLPEWTWEDFASLFAAPPAVMTVPLEELSFLNVFQLEF